MCWIPTSLIHWFERNIVHVLKAVANFTGEQWNLSTFFVVSNFSSNKRSPERRLRASLCKILISSFAHKMDLAHNFSVDFF